MRRNYMNWDSRGRLILGDECIDDSHIVDLLRDIASVNKKRVANSNSLQLKKLLELTHCPKSILNIPVK